MSVQVHPRYIPKHKLLERSIPTRPDALHLTERFVRLENALRSETLAHENTRQALVLEQERRTDAQWHLQEQAKRNEKLEEAYRECYEKFQVAQQDRIQLLLGTLSPARRNSVNDEDHGYPGISSLLKSDCGKLEKSNSSYGQMERQSTIYSLEGSMSIDVAIEGGLI